MKPKEVLEKWIDCFNKADVIAAEWMYHPYHFEMYQS